MIYSVFIEHFIRKKYQLKEGGNKSLISQHKPKSKLLSSKKSNQEHSSPPASEEKNKIRMEQHFEDENCRMDPIILTDRFENFGFY